MLEENSVGNNCSHITPGKFIRTDVGCVKETSFR